MDVWVSLISTIGFPIAACLAMAWYVKYMTDKNNSEVKLLIESHKEEINHMNEALNNNTLALQKLCMVLGKADILDEGGL